MNEVRARGSNVADTYILQRLSGLMAGEANIAGIYHLQKVHELVAGEAYIAEICTLQLVYGLGAGDADIANAYILAPAGELRSQASSLASRVASSSCGSRRGATAIRWTRKTR